MFGKRKAKKEVKAKKPNLHRTIKVNEIVDCVNCNKKFDNDGKALCVACRQV